MKKIIFALIVISFNSCGKKDPGINTKNPNNHMEASVTFSSGNTLTINETGQNVTLSIDFLGGYYATVKNSQKQEVSISISDYDNNGVDDGSAVYYPNYEAISEEYRSYNLEPGDTFYFTNINGTHREANFKLTCIKSFPADTLKVSGSFKGEFE